MCGIAGLSIIGLATGHQPIANEDRTVSGACSASLSEPAFDELEHARRVARHFDTDHHELILRPDPPPAQAGVWRAARHLGKGTALPLSAPAIPPGVPVLSH
jgi:asparagine synthetase B (glutamine-hydrolysing)